MSKASTKERPVTRDELRIKKDQEAAKLASRPCFCYYVLLLLSRLTVSLSLLPLVVFVFRPDRSNWPFCDTTENQVDSRDSKVLWEAIHEHRCLCPYRKPQPISRLPANVPSLFLAVVHPRLRQPRTRTLNPPVPVEKPDRKQIILATNSSKKTHLISSSG